MSALFAIGFAEVKEEEVTKAFTEAVENKTIESFVVNDAGDAKMVVTFQGDPKFSYSMALDPLQVCRRSTKAKL